MKKEINIQDLGHVNLNINALTEKISITVNGVEAHFIDKLKNTKNYTVKLDDDVRYFSVNGNTLKGFKVEYNGYSYQLTKPVPWYIYPLAFIPFIMTMVLGNIPAFIDIGFYYVGGAVGGLISGLMTGISFVLMTKFEKTLVRLLVAIGAIILTFLICWGVGSLIVAAATK